MRTDFTPGELFDARRRQKLRAFVAREAFRLEREIKLAQTNSSPSGRTYRIGRITSGAKKFAGLGLKSYKTKKGNKRYIVGATFHRASARGQAPAIRTGGLLNATKAQQRGEFQWRVINSKKYGAALDNPNGLNRPFFKSTFIRFRAGFLRRAKLKLENL